MHLIPQIRLILAACAGALVISSSCQAIGIRHDVAPEYYEALAANTGDYAITSATRSKIPDFSAVVAIGAQGPKRFEVVGTGVLIAPDWVLTAAHVVMAPKGRKADFDLDLRVRFGDSATENYQEYSITEYHLPLPVSKLRALHGRSLLRGERQVVHAEFHDIALIRLDRPVFGATPLPCCDDFTRNLVGQKIYIAGFGDAGAGNNPREETWAPAEIKRAAQNVIDRDISVNPLTGARQGGILLFDFDSGSDGRNSLDSKPKVWGRIFGDGHSSARPAPLEGASYPGDSGGPALAYLGSRWRVVGVSAYGTGYPADRRRTSIQYGDILVYTKVASHAAWINSTINRPRSSTPTPNPVVPDPWIQPMPNVASDVLVAECRPVNRWARPAAAPQSIARNAPDASEMRVTIPTSRNQGLKPLKMVASLVNGETTLENELESPPTVSPPKPRPKPTPVAGLESSVKTADATSPAPKPNPFAFLENLGKKLAAEDKVVETTTEPESKGNPFAFVEKLGKHTKNQPISATPGSEIRSIPFASLKQPVGNEEKGLAGLLKRGDRPGKQGPLAFLSKKRGGNAPSGMTLAQAP